MKSKCKVDGCGRDQQGLADYCVKHNARFKRYGDPLKLKRSPRFATPAESFAAKTVLNKETGCLEWTGATSWDGYGCLSAGKGKVVRAHRWVWESVHGAIPKKPRPHTLFVMHKCDNRKCCNVDHLMLGTHDDNMADMVMKGRGRYRFRQNSIGKTQESPLNWYVDKDFDNFTLESLDLTRKSVYHE